MAKILTLWSKFEPSLVSIFFTIYSVYVAQVATARRQFKLFLVMETAEAPVANQFHLCRSVHYFKTCDDKEKKIICDLDAIHGTAHHIVRFCCLFYSLTSATALKP